MPLFALKSAVKMHHRTAIPTKTDGDDRALVTMISIYGRVKLESRIILHEQKNNLSFNWRLLEEYMHW
jgi:hypothetical protein